MDLGIRSSEDAQIRYPKLDIGDPESIKSLANSIQNEHEQLDVLINNAGVNYENEYSPRSVESTLKINYSGSLQASFLPIM